MCGRFSLKSSPEDIDDLLPDFQTDTNIQSRYNIAPSQPILTSLNDGKNKLTFTQWGLIPSWSKDPARGLINARAETLAEKPAFRHCFKRTRCLIPADGFFEWRKIPGQKTKQPVYFRMKSGKPFMFAGLWDKWCDREGGVLSTSAIITTAPNDIVRPVHNRMPVILCADDYAAWLDPEEREPHALQNLLKPYPAEEMETYPVSKRINNPSFDDPACILRQP